MGMICQSYPSFFFSILNLVFPLFFPIFSVISHPVNDGTHWRRDTLPIPFIAPAFSRANTGQGSQSPNPWSKKISLGEHNAEQSFCAHICHVDPKMCGGFGPSTSGRRTSMKFGFLRFATLRCLVRCPFTVQPKWKVRKAGQASHRWFKRGYRTKIRG